MADPDVPPQKRSRLDAASASDSNSNSTAHHPLYNGHPFQPPPLPPHTQPSRPPSHSTLVQLPPHSPSSRHYPSHSLPAPFPHTHPHAHPHPHSHPPHPHGQAPPYQPSLPSPLVPPSDIRSFADPRSIPSPSQRPHGMLSHPPVTHAQDRTVAYRPPQTPQPSSVSDNQRSRSTSISVEVKSQHSSQGMEHAGHHSPWSAHPENCPNGYAHTASSPHSTSQPVYPPSQPQPNGQQYAPPAAHYVSQSPYASDFTTSQQVRRKQVRATQACNHCRSRKQKCDEARPCQFCRENNFDCQYKDVPPPKQDRSMMQLQETVNKMQDTLDRFISQSLVWQESVESRFDSVENNLKDLRQASDAAFRPPLSDQGVWAGRMPTQGRSQSRVNSMKMESPAVSASNMSPAGLPTSTSIKLEAMFHPATPADSIRTNGSQISDTVVQEKTGLQGDHTTPAHKLLEEWQNMNVFYQDVPYLKKITEKGKMVSQYPMLLEQDRGQLRTWGVGEGHDVDEAPQAPGSPESNYGHSDGPSPAPSSNIGRADLWGYPPMDHSSPAAPREFLSNEGGLDYRNHPDIHSATLRELLDSYLTNMHALHPFMNRSKLKRLFADFAEQYSPDIKSTPSKSPAPGIPHGFNPGIKRKRSSNAFEPYTPRGPIRRTIRNAIVLLVCALGKVFQYTDKRLPAPYKEKLGLPGALGNTDGSPHPTSSSNSESCDDLRHKNIEILPGMAYFAFASEITGSEQGGNTVQHAQAMILGGLYLSQFARVLESWSWIHCACRIALVLIKADYPKLLRSYYLPHGTQGTAKERYQKNSVMCIYWTCLQLESDILAEMSTLTPSGISEHQSNIMYPAGVSDRFPTEDGAGYENQLEDGQQNNDTDSYAMMIYSSQIWLRVILNEAHNALYGASGRIGFDVTNVKEVVANAKIHIDILASWKKTLPPALDWVDGDTPPTDLNLARLRAKYYGGLYMMLRPYLRIAIHVLEFPPAPATANQHDSDEHSVHMVDLTEDQQVIIEIACKCIESAVRSTIAFDRVGADPDSVYTEFESQRTKRLIVTNIFGTLHAQFGNILVLTSVLKSKLYPRVARFTSLNRANLTALLERTIAIIEEVSPNSPILSMDLEILRNLQAHEGL